MGVEYAWGKFTNSFLLQEELQKVQIPLSLTRNDDKAKRVEMIKAAHLASQRYGDLHGILAMGQGSTQYHGLRLEADQFGSYIDQSEHGHKSDDALFGALHESQDEGSQ